MGGGGGFARRSGIQVDRLYSRPSRSVYKLEERHMLLRHNPGLNLPLLTMTQSQ
jgi:hypothetical protein